MLFFNGFRPRLIVQFLFVALCILALCLISQYKSFEKYHINGVNYIGAKSSESNVDSPVVIAKTNQHLLVSLDANFKFMTQDATFSYGNLFQTGDEDESVRMELQPHSSLFLVLGNSVVLPISTSIEIGKYYSVKLKYERHRFLKVIVDGSEVLNILDKNILDKKLYVSNFVVGTGFAQQRSLDGNIKDFNLELTKRYTETRVKLAQLMLIFLCGAIFVLSLFKKPFALRDSNSDISPVVVGLLDITAIFGIMLSITAVVLFSISFLDKQNIGVFKWLVHVMIPVALVITQLVFIHQNRIFTYLKWPFSFMYFLYVILLVFMLVSDKNVYNTISLSVIALSVLPFLVSITKGGFKKIEVILLLVIVLLFSLLSWSSLLNMTNWEVFVGRFDSSYGLMVLGAFLLLRLVVKLVLDSSTDKLEINDSYTCLDKSTEKYCLSRFYIHFCVAAILLWLSFRHDSLFVDGAAYHWQYYVGVIQGIKNGGWLMWDTPSQYGFMNLILASLIPTKNSWQAFYIFQSLLLFFVSAAIYAVTVVYLNKNTFYRLGVFLTLCMALFFADPAFIGPYPFPSSSVVRFFCVYLMVLSVCFVPKFGMRQAVLLCIAWALSVVWSAESAVYGTAILLFVLVAMTQVGNIGNTISLFTKYFATALFCLTSVTTLITLFYSVNLGEIPDFASYYEYAIGYASGFGYVPFPLSGPGNLLLLVFVGVSILCIRAIQLGGTVSQTAVAPFAAMAGAIWGVATYYIGRPVPQNVTAILPIITMVLILSLILSRKFDSKIYVLPIKAVAISVFFLVLIPIVDSNWYSKLVKIESFSTDVASKLPTATAELERLVDKSGISVNTPVVYYGDDAAMPRFLGKFSHISEKNWLPIPLQLLEQPISVERRRVYLKRYLCRNKPISGVIINKKGGAISERLQGFLYELSYYYSVQELASDNTYAIYRFSDSKLINCN